jgi:pyruvate/2-oxoglutarate/acetoin dehydrogenase E1 component/TPP-dependent pyruvate/acetoin dehydrogenase alpha subunit
LSETSSAGGLAGLYGRIRLIRRFEETVEGLFAGGELAGTTHACTGQEAVAVGVVSALAPEDIVVSNHRGHGHLLAKGGEPGRLMAELFGKRDGYSLGRGGSQHVACGQLGFLGANGITGGGIPVATGEALAVKRGSGDSRVVCCFFGDGAANQGTFAESLNMAALWKLPVLYVLENNCWAFSTRTEEGCALPSPECKRLAGRAAPFGIPHDSVDGNDVGVVLAAAAKAVEHVRGGRGPYLLECNTYRLSGHSKSDRCEYRPDAEEDRWRARCPIRTTRDRLLEAGTSEEQIAEIDSRVEDEIRSALEFARQSPVLELSEAVAGVYARPVDPRAPDPAAAEPADAEEIYGWEAVQRALREELDRDAQVILLGEDIAEYGGAFKVTRNMAADYGPERVINTPISENSIVGLAAGAAMLGLRPVVEMMFADFALLAYDQLANHAAKFHYMYAGQVNVPVTVRMPTGGYRGYGPTHSQCVEGLFQGVPGLKIVAPSTPREARALLKAAIRDDDPVLFIEHKLLYGARGPVPRGEEVAPIGRARVVRTGGDVTLVAHGYMVTAAERAAEALAAEGVSAEVLDLRTLKPLDEETVLESVARTMHLVTVEEGWTAGGFGAEVAARVAEKGIACLDGPIVRVGTPDSPIPASRPLEDAVLPNPAKIVAAAKRALGG